MAGKAACGIDFGTSNSTVAVALGADRRLVQLEAGHTTLPSALFFRKDATPLFGRAAVDAYMYGDEGRFMRGLKKILGTSLMEEKTQVGNRAVAFTDILQIFLSRLKEQAEQDAGQPISHVVMGRPVHFHDDDADADAKSQATLEAVARSAGFTDVEFLFEPIAAAFAHEAGIMDEKLSLVVDLGGGTSDFTVIRIGSELSIKADRRDDILSTSGVRVGGTTFDYRLSLKKFMPEFGMGTKYHDIFDKQKHHRMPTGVYFQLADWAMANFAQTRKAIIETLDIRRRTLAPDKIDRLLKLQQSHLGHALLAQVEKTKIELTDLEKFTSVFEELDLKVPVTRKAFEQSIAQDVVRVFASIDECLKSAGINADKIDLVIMTGGSSELPIINKSVSALFPSAVLSQGNKLDSVGLGLAYRAGNIF